MILGQNLVRGRVRRNLLRIARIAPYVFLWIDTISYLLYEFRIYKEYYLYLLSISGHSVFWVCYTAILLLLIKTCLYTWVCMLALLSFNVLSLLDVSESYYSIFQFIIIFTGIAMSTTLLLKKCFKTRYTTL